jgi:inner membrane protein
MASLVSHAVAALALGAAFYEPGVSKRVWVAGAAVSMVPDLDVLGFRFGIRYGDFLGHRGFTHSLVFAAALAALAAAALRREARLGAGALWVYLFLAAASHGLLDAMTDGGLGVAFFSPFDNGRSFLPWRPIAVSPIGIGRFFTSRGLAVLESELLAVWLPALLFAALALFARRARSKPTSGGW